jgi:hypothetical protein
MSANADYASPRPWKVKRATWGSYLIVDATGDPIAEMLEPAPEVSEANAALMAEGANALMEKEGE